VKFEKLQAAENIAAQSHETPLPLVEAHENQMDVKTEIID